MVQLLSIRLQARLESRSRSLRRIAMGVMTPWRRELSQRLGVFPRKGICELRLPVRQRTRGQGLLQLGLHTGGTLATFLIPRGPVSLFRIYGWIWTQP